MKPLRRDVVEQALQQEIGSQFLTALRRLPADVDPSIATDAVMRLLGPGGKLEWLFARNCQGLPAPVISLVLDCLARAASGDPVHLFLREAMRLRGERALEDAWASALLALLDLSSSYAWGSKQKKAKFRALANAPPMLAAAQAAVVGSKTPPVAMLAVLAAHGGEEAADALLTVFSGGALDERLEQLATHAADTPAMQSLLSSVSQRLETSASAGPFAAFARSAWGFDPGRARVSLSFGSALTSTHPGQQGLSRYQAGARFDSDREPWWSAWISDLTEHDPRERSISFSSNDARLRAPGLEACAVEELPRWFAETGKKLGAGGWRAPMVLGSLRGKKRDAVVRWLLGG